MQGPVSYDSNGYINTLAMPDYGPNPWEMPTQQSQQYANNAQNAAAGIPGMRQNLQGQEQNYNQYAQATQAPQAPQTSSYPAMPNQYGLGQQGGSNSASNDTSRGFNPWSLQGEALSR